MGQVVFYLRLMNYTGIVRSVNTSIDTINLESSVWDCATIALFDNQSDTLPGEKFRDSSI